MGCFKRMALKHNTLPYIKYMTSASLRHDTGHSKPALRDNLEGEDRLGREVSWGFRMDGTHTCLWLIHTDVWQNSSQYCIYIPIKINRFFKKWAKVGRRSKGTFLQRIYTDGQKSLKRCSTSLITQFSSVQSLSHV